MRALACVSLVSLVAAGSLLAGLCPPTPENASSGGGPDDGTIAIQTQNTWAIMAPKAGRVIDSKIRVRPPGSPGDDGGIAGSDPAEVGMWAPPIPFTVIAIHASVLRTGEVLAYAFPGANQAKVWSPTSGTFTPVNMPDDIFCSGHAQLQDGRVYVAGGNQSGCDFKGIADTNIFDPITRVWSPLADMTDGRWYPTCVTMPDGRVMIFSGLGFDCDNNPVAEMYTPGVGLSIVPEGERSIDLYPRMHVLTSGKIAHVAPDNSARTFQLGVGWQFVDWNNFGWRSQGTSVLLPGFTDRVMIIGGGGPVTNTCEIINFAAASPQWAYSTPMTHARAHCNATILPDKTVLVVGGGQDGQFGSPVLTPELYDPASGTWTLLPSHVHGRMYHSTSVLLPDGRVLVAGQNNGPSANTAEIYSPPYLFRGARPVIGSTPLKVGYGQAFTINTPDAATIQSVVLMKLANVTHSVTFDQRLLEVPFVATDGAALLATAPPSGNHAPPGYYMLIALNGSDVPSVAKMILVSSQATADINGDGTVNVLDLLTVINAWGPCAAPATCVADVVLDNEVNVLDLLMVINNWS